MPTREVPDSSVSSTNTSSFYDRIALWFKTLLKLSTRSSNQDHSGPPVLIVSHGAYIHALLRILSRWSGFYIAPEIDQNDRCSNTSIMRVRCWTDDRKWWGIVETWADVDHLAGMIDEDLGVADDV